MFSRSSSPSSWQHESSNVGLVLTAVALLAGASLTWGVDRARTEPLTGPPAIVHHPAPTPVDVDVEEEVSLVDTADTFSGVPEGPR